MPLMPVFGMPSVPVPWELALSTAVLPAATA
jgi:hypothetical protein